MLENIASDVYVYFMFEINFVYVFMLYLLVLVKTQIPLDRTGDLVADPKKSAD